MAPGDPGADRAQLHRRSSRPARPRRHLWTGGSGHDERDGGVGRRETRSVIRPSGAGGARGGISIRARPPAKQPWCCRYLVLAMEFRLSRPARYA
jgi:hypothetical protein